VPIEEVAATVGDLVGSKVRFSVYPKPAPPTSAGPMRSILSALQSEYSYGNGI
jgi:hypothetical protein